MKYFISSLNAKSPIKKNSSLQVISNILSYLSELVLSAFVIGIKYYWTSCSKCYKKLVLIKVWKNVFIIFILFYKAFYILSIVTIAN